MAPERTLHPLTSKMMVSTGVEPATFNLFASRSRRHDIPAGKVRKPMEKAQKNSTVLFCSRYKRI
jgi:hypothetical protein